MFSDVLFDQMIFGIEHHFSTMGRHFFKIKEEDDDGSDDDDVLWSGTPTYSGQRSQGITLLCR